MAHLFVLRVGTALYFLGYPLKINISTKQNNVLYLGWTKSVIHFT
jgi:hypothetical protein